jgi:hypothetical protein
MKYTVEESNDDAILEVNEDNDEESRSQASGRKRNQKVAAKKGITAYHEQKGHVGKKEIKKESSRTS